MDDKWTMEAQAGAFTGSQDILFPEDAPPHYDSSENVYYTPPGSSSYSSYSQEVKYIFPPEDRFQSAHEFSELKDERRPSPDRWSRRSSQSASERETYNMRDKDTTRLALTPMSINLDVQCASDTSFGLKVSPSLENQAHGQSPLYKTTPRYDSRASPRSSWSARSADSPGYDGKQRKDSLKNGRGVDHLAYHTIPEQEIYTELHSKVSPQAEFHPAIRPPPYWCKLYTDRHKDALGDENVLFASRRKTWSPPTCHRSLSCINNLHAIRSYRSNEHLDCNEDTCQINAHPEALYEDLDTVVAPPQITPVSGILNKIQQIREAKTYLGLMKVRDAYITGQKGSILLTIWDNAAVYMKAVEGDDVYLIDVITGHNRFLDRCHIVIRHEDQIQNSQKLLIKPVAFKPVMTSSTPRFNTLSPIQHSSTLPSSLAPTRRALDLKSSGHCHDDGYASQEYSSGSHSHSTSNTSSQNSSYQVSDGDRSMSHGSESKTQAHSGSGGLSSVNRLSSSHNEGHHQTPSPSDSGVGELETIIRDKDAEIKHLRDTMEHNETVIFQVYEEKRQNWAMQLKGVVSEWERRLQFHQEKSSKMEQTLLLQLFKCQQERNGLRLDLDQLTGEKNQLLSKCKEIESENNVSKRRLEDQQWETAQKAGEVSLLKAQLKEANEAAISKNNDLLCIKSQLKDFTGTKSEQERETQRLKDEVKRLTQETLTSRSELERLRRLVSRPKSDRLVQTEESRPAKHSVGSGSGMPDSVKPASAGVDDTGEVNTDQVALVKMQLMELQERYEKDKEQWLVEKDKVINYQKHLQLNYVQMFRKNKMLELEMEQLMVELENKDLTLSEKLGSETSEGFESTC